MEKQRDDPQTALFFASLAVQVRRDPSQLLAVPLGTAQPREGRDLIGLLTPVVEREEDAVSFLGAFDVPKQCPCPDGSVKGVLALGDYYMFEHNPQRGRQVYTDAWTLLSEDESRLDARYEQLEKIVVLRERPLPKYINAADSAGGVQSDDPLLQGHVRLSYEITTRGRAAKIKLIEANPPEFVDMQRYVQREIRQRIFRPRFEEAKAVLTPDQQLAHTFFYRQADLDALTSGKSADGKK